MPQQWNIPGVSELTGFSGLTSSRALSLSAEPYTVFVAHIASMKPWEAILVLVTQGTRDHRSCRAACFPRATIRDFRWPAPSPRHLGGLRSLLPIFLSTISEELG